MKITLTDEGMEKLQQEGINTINQLKIVMAADKESKPCLAEIAEVLGVSGPSAHQALARMEENKLVRKVKYTGEQPGRGRITHAFIRTARIDRLLKKLMT